MARYTNALAQANWVIKCLFGLIAGSMVVTAFAIIGWRSAPKDLTMHIPPNLTTGAQVKIGSAEVPPSTVYLFSFYIWQQLNRWSKNGQQDYGNQIYKLQAYFTPACQQQLVTDLKTRADHGELDQRTRSIMEIQGMGFSEDKVVAQSNGSWNVNMDTQVLETSRGIVVKDAFIRYPIHVVRYDVDRELNPWQLAVDCYVADRKPERLDPKAVELAVLNSKGSVENTQAYADKSMGAGGVRTVAPTGSPRHGPVDGSMHQAVPAPLVPATLPSDLK